MGPLADLTDTPGHDGTDAWSASADPLCTADALELASLIWCSDAGTRPILPKTCSDALAWRP